MQLDSDDGLCAKIARLVQERGLNQDEFARAADLNRLTVRHMFQGGPRRLHNATVAACARALDLSVRELRELPLEALLPRMRSAPANGHDALAECKKRLYDQATQPELMAWIERNPERAAKLTPQEIDELLSLQGTGGPLTGFGVAHFVELIERKRRLMEMVAAVAGTEYIDLLEKIVELMYDKIQPYKGRV